MLKKLLKTRPSKLKIENSIFTGKNKNKNIDEFLTILKFHKKNDLIFELASDKRLPYDYSPVYTKNENFHILNRRFNNSNESYVYWILGLFKKDLGIIKFFLKKQNEFSMLFLNGDHKKCFAVLDEIDSICLSWWSIKNRIATKAILLNENPDSYIDELKIKHPHLNLSSIINDFKILIKSSNDIDYYHALLLSRFNEYKKSGIEEALHEGNIDSCNLLPITFDLERDTDFNFLQSYKEWSLIDNYLIFKSIVVDRYSLKKNIFKEKEVEKIAMSLLNDIGDIDTINLILNNNVLIDKDVEDIVKNYTIGNYHYVVDKIDSLVQSLDRKCFDLFEIYTKSKIYLGSNFKANSFYNKVCSHYAKVLNLADDSYQAKAYLYYLALFTRHDHWGIALITHISLNKSISNNCVNEIIIRQNHILGSINTPKSRSINFVEENKNLNHLLPAYRGNKESIKDPNQFIIYSDYLKFKIDSFDFDKELNELIDFCITEYFENKNSYNFFPITDIYEKIRSTDDFSGIDKIGSLLILDIYRNESEDSVNDLINKIFDLLLQDLGGYKPSQIFSGKTISDKEFVFLKNICTPIILDSIVDFNSNDEVINERVSIIDFLLENKNLPELQIERDRVLESMLSEKLRAKIESGKLYVDVQAIESQKRSSYDQLFKNYQIASSIKYDINNVGLEFEEINEYQNKKLLLAAKIYGDLVADFALNEEYGLDKYLSAEVRHQVFKSEIRVNFEKNNLISQKNKDNYITNIFWSRKYSFVSPDILSQINDRLNVFSRSVDEIIENANNRLRIGVTLDDSDYIFDFRPTENIFSDISHILDNSNIENYFDNLIDYMWSWAERCAKNAQIVINDEMLPLLIGEVSSLKNDIMIIKSVVPMEDLIASIDALNTDIKNSTEKIINWFRFVGSKDDISYEKISVVVDATIASINGIYSGRGKSIEFISDPSDILLSYQESKALFISIFTALENSLKYGVDSECVKVYLKTSDKSTSLQIINKLSISYSDTEYLIESIKSKWGNEGKILNIKEGGSGIYKIRDMLLSVSPGFFVDVCIDHDQFILKIEAKNESFDNRG